MIEAIIIPLLSLAAAGIMSWAVVQFVVQQRRANRQLQELHDSWVRINRDNNRR